MNENKTYSAFTQKNLKLESKAFNTQIMERVENGYIPDLRSKKKNLYFYNNVWRDPYLVEKTFGNSINLFKKHLDKNSRIIEIGCGPGYLSLELARMGHQVLGIDLSEKAIEVAISTAVKKDKDLIKTNRLSYISGDFNEITFNNEHFDVAIFYGSLSHFPDLKKVSESLKKVLKKNSNICVWDTCVKQYEKKDVDILALFRIVLTWGQLYYENIKDFRDLDELEHYITGIKRELMFINEDGNKSQSPNDNSQDLKSMINFLKKDFKETFFDWESSFSRMLIGGIRHLQDKKVKKIVDQVLLLEKYLIKSNTLNPAFFHWIGKKKNN